MTSALHRASSSRLPMSKRKLLGWPQVKAALDAARCAGPTIDERLYAEGLPEVYKRVLYRAWSLRNQYNGEHDRFYFPALVRAMRAAFPDDTYPEGMLPKSLKAVRTRALNALKKPVRRKR